MSDDVEFEASWYTRYLRESLGELYKVEQSRHTACNPWFT